MPYHLPDAYVFEQLVSYRSRCRPDTRRAADYLHVIWPAFGPVSRQLPPGSTTRRVASTAIEFNGRTEHVEVYFQPRAAPNPLPPRLGGDCRT
jgi:hypothetical protein